MQHDYRFVTDGNRKIRIPIMEVRNTLTPVFWPSTGEYYLYDKRSYRNMTGDTVRNTEYVAAIRRHVSGKKVVDIGTGADLNWALVSLEAGATKAYAIEELRRSYDIAKVKIVKMELEEKVSLILGNSRNVGIPEKVDICVSELIGNIATAEGILATLHDAKRRFLKPRFKMIPEYCVTRIAVATLPQSLYERPSFDARSIKYIEKIFQNYHYPFDIRLCVSNQSSIERLSTFGRFEELDFRRSCRLIPRRSIQLRIQRSGRADGFVLWVEVFCDTYARKIDSFAQQTKSWMPVFFPVFYPGLEVFKGDLVCMDIETTMSEDGVHPDYQISGWVGAFESVTNFHFVSSHHGSSFRQTALYRNLFN